jgi:hypothetical protein
MRGFNMHGGFLSACEGERVVFKLEEGLGARPKLDMMPRAMKRLLEAVPD